MFKDFPNLHRLYDYKYLHCTFTTCLVLCLHWDLSTSNLSLSLSLSACPNFILFFFFLSWSQCATIGRMQTAAATGMRRWCCGSAGDASKSERSGLQGGRQMMLLWIILSSSLSLMVDGQMKIAPETWVPRKKEKKNPTTTTTTVNLTLTSNLIGLNKLEEPF